MDPKNRNKVKSNLTYDEQQALKDCVKLQKERKNIVDKQCDKGAGVIILDYQDYIKAGEEHLKQTIDDDTGNQKPLKPLKAKQCPSSIAISKSTRTMIIFPL